MWWKQCVRSQDVVEVGEIEDCMVEAMCREQGCGWR